MCKFRHCRASFSFDGIKNITSGEGGAVVIADKKVSQFVTSARLLGIKKDSTKRYKGQRSWKFDVMHQGYRYHMSNLFAAIGLAQLRRLEKEFKPARQKLARRYHNALKDMKEIILFPNNYDKIIPHIFPIRVINGKRDGLRWYLQNNIECGLHYLPNYLLTYYGAKKGQLPVTERIYRELLSLPLHPDLNKRDLDYVIEKVKEFLKGN